MYYQNHPIYIEKALALQLVKYLSGKLVFSESCFNKTAHILEALRVLVIFYLRKI
jgi:hypothetical protein